MGLRFGSKAEWSQIIVGELRRTQIITTFGPGSIVDMPDFSVIMAATDYWSDNCRHIQEPNLQRLLNVNYFKEPLIKANGNEDNVNITPDTPALRFPEFCFCPKCGKLDHFKAFGSLNNKECPHCHQKLIPSRFVVACINGHLEDFPYKWWVHQHSKVACDDIGKATRNLSIKFKTDSGGLDSIVIKCNTCGAERSMEGALGLGALKGYVCHGNKPWLKYSDNKKDSSCEAQMRGLQRGASNVYFPITTSALTIPPWSRAIYKDLNSISDQLELFIENSSNNDDVILLAFISAMLKNQIKAGLYTAQEVLDLFKSQKKHEEGYSLKSMLEDEYKVFLRRNYQEKGDVQFRIQGTDVSPEFNSFIDDIIEVKRLREVLALRGFRRIEPELIDDPEENKKYEGYALTDGIVPLSLENLKWLPAIEMLGEGIFVKLNEERLAEWEKRVGSRYNDMRKRLANSMVRCENFSPRYVLLHTLSHLLIRQMTMDCGYSGASIKERIYSSFADSDLNMAGILLYTSSSDSDGSLGGLARNALPVNFTSIFKNMLREASWCSSDPVCMDSKGQGFDTLNYSACHACTLLPETSCIMRNCLLDRCAVVGSIENRSIGYFYKFITD